MEVDLDKSTRQPKSKGDLRAYGARKIEANHHRNDHEKRLTRKLEFLRARSANVATFEIKKMPRWKTVAFGVTRWAGDKFYLGLWGISCQCDDSVNRTVFFSVPVGVFFKAPYCCKA